VIKQGNDAPSQKASRHAYAKDSLFASYMDEKDMAPAYEPSGMGAALPPQH
jgi:hypothetical protein